METSKTTCPATSGHSVRLDGKVGGQTVQSFNGTEKPILDTTAETQNEVVVAPEQEKRTRTIEQLVDAGIFESRAITLVDSHGVDVCRRQLSYLPDRLAAAGRDVTNIAGLLIKAIAEDWQPIQTRQRTRVNASPIAPGFREHIAREASFGRVPTSTWLRETGVSANDARTIVHEESEPNSNPVYPLADALREDDPERYDTEMRAIYVTLNRPFENHNSYQHPFYLSKCRMLLEAKLAALKH